MNVIIKPVLTEKMTIQGEKLNRYGFIVDVRANKLQIRNAVEQMYNVVVTDVNTNAIRAVRFGSYSIVFTVAAIPSFVRLKSTRRYICL